MTSQNKHIAHSHVCFGFHFHFLGRRPDSLRTLQEDDTVKVEKSKRGGGGGWRAYVHEKLRGKKATAEDFKEAGRQYRSLTAEEKEHYLMLGTAATTARKEGRVSFPAQSSTASYLRRQQCPQVPVIPKPQKRLDDDIAERVRLSCQEGRRESKMKKLQQHAELISLKRFSEGAREVLCKHRLLDCAGVKWWAIPHSTTGLLAAVTAEQLLDTRFLQAPAAQQHALWVQQHRGILEQNAQSLPALTAEQQRCARPRRCLQTGVCLCRGLGLMWCRVSARLKGAIDGNPATRKSLMQGDIILEWVVMEEDQSVCGLLHTHSPDVFEALEANVCCG